jgi:hypothetical protein
MKHLTRILVFIFCMLAFLRVADAAYAQSFKFQLSNVTQTIQVGSQFQVRVMIETGNQQTINGDALINFDPNKVSIDNATSGNFFTYFSAVPISGTSNQYLVSSWEESVAHAKSTAADTLFATLTLTAKQAGSTALSFECTSGSEADSNINRSSDSQDILSNCGALVPLSLTIGSGGGGGSTTPSSTPVPTGSGSGTGTTSPSATPIPTAIVSSPTPTVIPTATLTPIPTNTPAPTATTAPSATPRPSVAVLPRAGTTEITTMAIGVGLLLTVAGALFIL